MARQIQPIRRALRLSPVVVLLAAMLTPVLGVGAAPTVLTFELSPNVYTTYPGVTGVSFPQGIEVYTCTSASCGTARSGTRAARGQFSGEFARDPFEATFSAGQSVVSLWVRSDEASRSPAVTYSATLRAYNASGTQVYSQAVSFSSSITWQPMSVGGTSMAAVIRRVVLTGGESGFTTNFIAVDDFSFEGQVVPSPSPDTQAPVVTIQQPLSGQVKTERNAPVDVHVTDDRSLRTVNGLVRYPSGEVAQPLDFCGSTFSGTCPAPSSGPVTFDPGPVSLGLPSNAPDGTYTIEVTACDNDSNCATETRTFVIDVPDPILRVTKSGSGTGTVTSTPVGIDCGTDCEHAYPNGTDVRLTVRADEGSRFIRWEGDCRGDGACFVDVREPGADVNAVFVQAFVVIALNESIAVTDTSVAAPPPTIRISETITVTDVLTFIPTVGVTEGVTVTDAVSTSTSSTSTGRRGAIGVGIGIGTARRSAPK